MGAKTWGVSGYIPMEKALENGLIPSNNESIENQKDSKNYRFWMERNWLDAEYYTDVPVNPLARLMAGYIARKMRKSIRKGNAKPVR